MLISISGFMRDFFRSNRKNFSHVKKLFLHENNGFLVGMAFCTVGLWHGEDHFERDDCSLSLILFLLAR